MCSEKAPRRTLKFELDDEQPLGVRVSKALAEEADVGVYELEQLGDSIDLSVIEAALDELDGLPESSATLTFPVADYLVTVRSEGEIQIHDA